MQNAPAAATAGAVARPRPWWLEPALIVAIVAIGFFVRIYDLRTIPPGLYNDEAAYAMDALDVAQGTHYAIFYERNNGREPLFIWITGMVFRLLGASAYTLRLTAALIGTLTIAATYWMVRAEARFAAHMALPGSLWARADFSVWAAAWVSLFLALSYWHISFSRLGFRAITLPLLLAITVAFFFRAWRRLRDSERFAWSDVLLAGAGAGAAFYSYTAGRFVIVLLGLGVGLSLLQARHLVLDRKRVFYAGLLMLAASLIVAAPMLAYFVQHPAAFATRAVSISILSPEFATSGPIAAFFNSAAKVALLFFTTHDPNLRHDPAQRPLFDIFLGLWLAAGCVMALVQWRRFTPLFFLMWALLFAAPAVLTAEGVPHSLRAIGMMPGIFVLPVAGMLWAGGRFFAKRQRLALLLPLPFLLVTGYSSVRSYFAAFADPAHFRDAYLTDYVDLGKAVSVYQGEGAWVLTLSPAYTLADSKMNVMDFYVRQPGRYATIRMDENAPAELDKIVENSHIIHVLRPYSKPDLTETSYVFLDAKQMMSFLLRRDALNVAAVDDSNVIGIPFTTFTLDDAPDFRLPSSYRPLEVNFVDRVHLVSLATGAAGMVEDANPVQANSNQLIWAILNWQSEENIDYDLKSSLVLLDNAGNIVGQTDELLTGDRYPFFRNWKAGEPSRTYHLLEAQPGTPPGRYMLALSVYEDVSGRVYPATAAGAAPEQRAVLGAVELLPPLAPPQIVPQHPLTGTLPGANISLAGYDLARSQIAPGETLDIALYWQAEITPTRALSAVVELVDDGGEVVSSVVGPPGGSAYPTSVWQPGFIVRDRRDLPLDAKAAEGVYVLQVRLVDGERTLGAADLAKVAVDGRPRLMERPLIQQPLDATFDANLRLAGVNGLPAAALAPGASLAFTFVWQPLRTPDGPLVRSVQLLDAGGALVAQQDTIPCDEQCPSTSWQRDEYLMDDATLALPADLPPGAYRLIVGWYSPETQQRQPAVDGDGAPLPDNMAPLPEIVIGK